jgi:hypothetical protein
MNKSVVMEKQKLDAAIITVAFGDYKKFLMRWAQSVAKLTILPNEIILGVDQIDSKLRTSLLELIPSLVILEIPRIGGIHFGLEYNFLISKTNSEWICKIDVDDLILPDAYQELADGPFDILAFNAENSETKAMISGIESPSAKKILEINDNLLLSLSPFRKWIWDRVKFRDIVFDDWAFWIESAKLDPVIKKSQKINYIYSIHENQATKKINISDEMLKIQEIRDSTKTSILDSRFESNKELNVIFNFYPLWPIHWETSLEIAESLTRLNQKVFLFNCNSDFSFCDSNPSNDVINCNNCVSRQNSGINLLSGKFHYSTFNESSAHNAIIKDFLHSLPDSMESLLNLCYGGFKIGEAVYSSLSSQWILNKRKFDFEDPYVIDLLTRSIRSTLKIYLNFSQFIKDNNISSVYIFNGRFSLTAAIVYLCSLNSIKFFIHERASDLEKFQIVQNEPLSSITNYKERVNNHWDNSSIGRRELIGHDFFVSRRKGIVKNWWPFLKLDSASPIEKFPKNKKIVTIFMSTESEFYPYLDWKTFPSDNQIEVIKEIIDYFDENSDFYFYVRAHPNQQKELENVNFDKSCFEKSHVKFFMPNSNIDSYQLLFESNVVIHFGSTIGLESTYWKIPSIALKASTYAGVDDIWYFPKDFAELLDLMITYQLPSKSQLNALKAGFYENTYGNFFLFSSEPELGRATFKGQDLTEIKGSIDISKKNFGLRIHALNSKFTKFIFMHFRELKKSIF